MEGLELKQRDGGSYVATPGLKLMFVARNQALYAYSADGDCLVFREGQEAFFVPQPWDERRTAELMRRLASSAGLAGRFERGGITNTAAGNHCLVLRD